MNVPNENPSELDALSAKELLALQYLLEEPGFDRSAFEADLENDLELMMALSQVVSIVEAISSVHTPSLHHPSSAPAAAPPISDRPIPSQPVVAAPAASSVALAGVGMVFAIAASLIAIFANLPDSDSKPNSRMEAIAAAWSDRHAPMTELSTYDSLAAMEDEHPDWGSNLDSQYDELPHWLVVAADRQQALQSESIQ